jgi:hypothetical protein
MEEEKKKPAESQETKKFDMAKFDPSRIKSLEQGFKELEDSYLKPFMEYCKSDFDKNSYKPGVNAHTWAIMIVK